MKKKMFLSRVSKKLDCTLIEAEKFINGIFDTIKDCLIYGNEVNIYGFGKFKTANRAAKKARNPKTMDIMNIKAYTTIVYSASKPLKDLIKSKFDK